MKIIKTTIVITMLLSIVGLTACSVAYRRQHPGYGHRDRGMAITGITVNTTAGNKQQF